MQFAPSLAQVMLSYRVPESGACHLGGDGTVVNIQAALNSNPNPNPNPDWRNMAGRA